MKLFTRLTICLLLIACSACQFSHQNEFCIKGTFDTAAANDTIWLEISELDQSRIIDSAIISPKGTFSFKEKYIGYPEFYALRYNRKRLPLIIDSCNTITIKASKSEFPAKTVIKGSDESEKIQAIDAKTALLNQKLKPYLQQYNDKQIDDSCFLSNVNSLIEEYKQFGSPEINNHLKSLSSYYILFQRIGNYSIYKYYDRADNSLFTALTNSFDANYPRSARTKHLHNLTLQGMKIYRQEQISQSLNNKQKAVGSFEIELPDRLGTIQTLSSLKGKAVLLDFTTYHTDYSPMRTIALNELYEKYKERGFEIYQVSFDDDEHFWKTSSDKLPWICVRDNRSVRSPYIQYYNIQKLPTYFLINKEGDIVIRNEDIKNIEEDLEKLL